VPARAVAYAEEAARRAEHDREFTALGLEYVGPEPRRIGENVDLDALVARLAGLTPAERAELVQTILDLPHEETDEDGYLEPEPMYLPYTYQYLSEAGLIDRPARPYQVMAYWYECE
jgi:hypothetical protein